MDIHISNFDVEDALTQLRDLNKSRDVMSDEERIKRGGETVCDLLNAMGWVEVTRAWRQLY